MSILDINYFWMLDACASSQVIVYTHSCTNVEVCFFCTKESAILYTLISVPKYIEYLLSHIKSSVDIC